MANRERWAGEAASPWRLVELDQRSGDMNPLHHDTAFAGAAT